MPKRKLQTPDFNLLLQTYIRYGKDTVYICATRKINIYDPGKTHKAFVHIVWKTQKKTMHLILCINILIINRLKSEILYCIYMIFCFDETTLTL